MGVIEGSTLDDVSLELLDDGNEADYALMSLVV